jgi:hypothetical protein
MSTNSSLFFLLWTWQIFVFVGGELLIFSTGVRVSSLSWKTILVILSWPVVVLLLRSLIRRRRGLKAK